jgi:hypothetical protein
MLMFSSILQGEKPTDVFKKLIAAEPRLSNWELARRFVDYFEEINSEARQAIWHWQRPGGRRGLSDDAVNESLEIMLRDAGYLVRRD